MIPRELMAAALAVVTVPLLGGQAQARTSSSAISVMSWNVCAGTNAGCFFYGRSMLAVAAKPGYRAVFGGDLNLAPPDSGQSTAVKRRILAPVYAAYAECDQNGDRDGRWTEKHVREDGGVSKRKLDYLFAPRGSVTRCHVAQEAASSDHKPIYLRAKLG
ncbi:hypothetical protein [Streptosporangium sp. CA-115845]|uniref:hypothetical protein n=1 Tax=Streptosporangium sp. CA-115845 TaxID=3240071 RepID=UPI003D8AB879